MAGNRKKKKGERYIDRWMKDKKKLTFILKKEEYEALKKFCDANMMSYREYFTQYAPRLIIENQELKKQLEEKEARLKEMEEKASAAVALEQELQRLKLEKEQAQKELEELHSYYSAAVQEVDRLEERIKGLEQELAAVKEEKDQLVKQLQEKEARVKELEEVLSIILKEGYARVPSEFCERLRPYGFSLHEKERREGFRKEVVEVCSNR